MPVIAAAATAYLTARWLTFLNRWEALRVEFKDPFIAVAQVVTVIATLLAGGRSRKVRRPRLWGDLSFTHVVLGLSLADIGMAVAVLVDRLIVAASLWSPTQRRR